jgi:hypothetical protein
MGLSTRQIFAYPAALNQRDSTVSKTIARWRYAEKPDCFA